MKLTIIHHHYHHQVEQTTNTKLDKIMATLEELKSEVITLQDTIVSLQAVVEAEKNQNAAILAANTQAVEELNAIIVNLTNQIESSVTADQLQSVVDDIRSASGLLETVKVEVGDISPDDQAV